MDDGLVLRLALALHSNPGVYALLLGSGLSSAAGIPTGWDIVGDLATHLAAMQHEEPSPDPQTWYANMYGEEADYSRMLDRLTGTAAERTSLLRSYFEPTDEEKEQGLKTPTKAHRAIAALVRLGYVRMIVTTNFDRLLETALQAEGFVPDIISTDDSFVGAIPYVHSKCTIIKVNGDYRDTRIKNTEHELSEYSVPMNALLDRILDDFGLVVCGWSGLWDIALRKAILRSPNRRYSCFWLSRGTLKDEGKQVVEQRRGEVLQIDSADQVFDTLLENVQALRDMVVGDPLPPKVAASTVKRYLPLPERRIRLHDLVMQELARVSTELMDKRFDPNGGAINDEESFGQLMHQYETCMGKLMAMLSAIGYHSGVVRSELLSSVDLHTESTGKYLLTRSIEGLVQSKSQAGVTALVDLQYYPALLACYAAGIAALSNQNYDALAATLLQPRIRESKYAGASPALLRINSLGVFVYNGSDKCVPRPNAKKEYTPANNYLFDVLRAVLSEYVPDNAKYEETFDIFEYLVGLTCLHLVGDKFPPTGCFLWRYKFAFQGHESLERSPLGEYISGEISKGANSGLLKAGFFDGDETKLKAIVDLYSKVVQDVVRRWR